MFLHIYQLVRRGEIAKSIQEISSYKKSTLTDEEESELNLILAEIYAKTNEYSKSLMYLKESTELSHHKYPKLFLRAKTLDIDIFIAKGHFVEAKEQLKCLSLYIHDNIVDKDLTNKYNSLVEYYEGLISFRKGEINKANLKLKESLLFFQNKEKYIDIYALILQTQGDVYAYKGNLKDALECYQHCFGIFDEQNSKRDIIITIGKIAKIYQLQGDFEDSQIYYEAGLKDLDLMNDPLLLSDILFNYILLLVDYRSSDELEKYIGKLELMAKLNDHSLIKQRFDLAYGIYLKNHERIFHKMQAQGIFVELVSETILDYEISIITMFNLLECLIFELGISGNAEVLVETDKLAVKLLEIAEHQQSYILLVKIYLLQGKLAILKLEFSEATHFLQKALDLARTNGLVNFVKLISNEQDLLLEQIDSWETRLEKDLSFKERIEFAQFQNTFDLMMDNKLLKLSLKPEKPVILLLLSEEGMSRFMINFDVNLEIDAHLTSGFISAINTFGRELFRNKGTLERIKHQEYTLLMKSVDKLIYCYAYSGQSYYAMQKLEEFVNIVSHNPSTHEYLYKKTMSEDGYKLLTSYAKSIFL